MQSTSPAVHNGLFQPTDTKFNNWIYIILYSYRNCARLDKVGAEIAEFAGWWFSTSPRGSSGHTCTEIDEKH